MALSRLSCNEVTCILLILFVGCAQLINGVPVDPAAVAADPSGAASSMPAAAAPGVAAPAVAPPAASVNPKVVPQQPVGEGIITEHKNPDGSTITVSRYNGPLPAGAFQNQFSPGLLTQLTGLHDYHQNNLYQTQLFHRRQQIEQATAAALLLQNMQIYNNFPYYRTTSTYLVPSYAYPTVPYFQPFYGFGYPFGAGYPIYGQPIKSA